MNGKTINGYTIQSKLGVGGMAEVWLAENKIGKKAAVKLLLPRLCEDEGIKARFFTEAKVMVELNHPNIRQVYDYGDIDGRPTIIMEYLEGDDLKAMMKHGRRFSEEELERWWNQIADALNYTHQKGIVHRDIKPSNIFIDTNGDVKLLDFGIAKVADVSSGTMTGSTLGTRIYMSPEQVKDPKRVGAASDVYSLAVSFVHLLTGKAPYDSTTSSDFDIQVSIVSKPVDLSPLPEMWRNFLAPYLAKEPEQRPSLTHFKVGQPAPFMDDEGTVVEGFEPTPQPTAPQPVVPKEMEMPKENVAPKDTPPDKPKSKKGLWIGLGVVAAAVVAVVAFLFLNDTNASFEKGKALYEAENYTEAMPLLIKAAEKGNARAQLYVGRMYDLGQGVDTNYVKALEWYRKSADQGDPWGQNNLGLMYKFGDGVTQDYAEAAKWFRLSADQDFDRGQCNLGEAYYYGRGVTQDYAEAANWFRKAADQGNDFAQNYLGWMYQYGQGVTQDDAEAVNWYRKAAEQGNAGAQYSLGFLCQQGQGVTQDDAEAANWYRKAAEQGLAEAQSGLGWMYQYGRGVTQDYAEAVNWYRKAAEQGDARGQSLLGIMYENGYGVTQDYAEALEWYTKSADQGYALGQKFKGFLYILGKGVKKDYKEARKWFQLAAEQGDAIGQYMMGMIYEEGCGVSVNLNEARKWYQLAADQGDVDAKQWLKDHPSSEKKMDAKQCFEQGNAYYDKGNYTEAMKWYRKAADQGFAAGQYAVGNLYEYGKGVKKDYNEARKWYQKAADQGYQDAAAALERIKWK